MAKNDRFLLDAIIEERAGKGLPSNKSDEVFEYLAYEQALKEYDLSSEEILSGSVDGEDDGGLDAIYIFVNGHLINDLKSMLPKSDVNLEVYFFTCKHRSSFRQDAINNMYTSLCELLDFSKKKSDFDGNYNADVLNKRELFFDVYRKLAPKIMKFSIRVIFASRGDAKNELGENVVARGRQIETLCREFFSGCDSTFEFWGAEEILTAYRKKADYSLNLVFRESLTYGKQMVVLARLSDFYDFITYEDGKIRKYLFDSNVRAYMGLNAVNEDIMNTLEKPVGDEDFWWLNNGITVLCSQAIPIGKTVTIENVQIVNGLQTAECIHRHFTQTRTENDDRVVLVKILPCDSAQIADDITRSTNNQTAIMSSSLRATDKLQADIEAILAKEDLFYERRVNFYANQGIPNAKILSPLYLAKGYVALVNKEPYTAVALRQKFMRKDESYRQVFSSDDDLRIWPVIAKIMKKTDEFIDTRHAGKWGDKRKSSIRYQLAFLTVSRMLGAFTYSPNDLLNFDANTYTFSQMTQTWNDIEAVRKLDNSNASRLQGKKLFLSVASAVAELEGIKGFASIFGRREEDYTEEFLNKVLECLPSQPWPRGVHKIVSRELGISEIKASKAIGALMNRGMAKRQKNGEILE